VRALVRTIGSSQEEAQASVERTPVREALASAGAVAVTELTAVLEHPSSPQVATSAAWVLGEVRATASRTAIVGALRKGVLPAAAAMHALAGAGMADTVPVVLEFVSDPSPVVRAEALRAAAMLLDPTRPDGRAVEPLAAALRDARTTVLERAQIVTLLGRTGAPRAAPELASLAKAKDPALRLAAIDAIGALGLAAPGAREGVADDVLVPLLGDRDPSTRLRAAVALAASGGLSARAALLAKLDEGEELDRYAVLTALGGILERLPDASAAKRLLDQLALAAGAERDALVEAAGRARLPSVATALAKLAESGDVDDRRAAVTSLGGHGAAPQASAALRRAAADPDASVRAQAAYALGEVGDAGALPMLAALARAGDVAAATNAAAALARLAGVPGRVPPTPLILAVCPLLADGRPTVRANALAALAAGHARCDGGNVERTLLAADANDLVRASAARALVAGESDADRSALDRCVSNDRSPEVARLCRGGVRGANAAVPDARRATRAVTAYVFGESASAPKPRAPYLVELEGGVLRAGAADRRGAVFDPAAPAGDLALRRMPR
jgi:HEAT repeat protein